MNQDLNHLLFRLDIIKKPKILLLPSSTLIIARTRMPSKLRRADSDQQFRIVVSNTL